MKTLNDYTFRSWHNGTGEDVEFTVHAETVDEAYENAYGICHNTPGLSYDAELIKSSTPLAWEVWVCDVDEIPGADWTLQCVAYTQDKAEHIVELELSEKRVSYAFLEATAMQTAPKELLETGIIRLLDMGKEVN